MSNLLDDSSASSTVLYYDEMRYVSNLLMIGPYLLTKRLVVVEVLLNINYQQ